MKTGPKPKPIAERFWAKVTETGSDDCWLWSGKSKDRGGYGKFYFKLHEIKHYAAASRIAFLLHHHLPLDFDPTIIIRHSCDNPPCCNPKHLLMGSNQDNSDDMVSRGRKPIGSQTPLAKITESDVIIIRQLYLGGYRQADIGRLFNINDQTVFNIVHKRSWKHVLQESA